MGLPFNFKSHKASKCYPFCSLHGNTSLLLCKSSHNPLALLLPSTYNSCPGHLDLVLAHILQIFISTTLLQLFYFSSFIAPPLATFNHSQFFNIYIFKYQVIFFFFSHFQKIWSHCSFLFVLPNSAPTVSVPKHLTLI